MRIWSTLLIVFTANAVLAEADLERIYDKVEPTSVEILVNGVHDGSGNFVSEDGLVLSASHIFVMMGMDGKIEVLSRTFGRLPASLVELDRAHDLALLRVENENNTAYPRLDVASRNPSVGTEIYSVSAPIFMHHSFNNAFISSNRVKYQKTPFCNGYVEVLRIVTLSPKGSSGCSWVNRAGEIVGVQSGWVDSLGGGNRNSGFSFMSSPAAIATFVETQKTPSLAWIGGTMEELWTQPRGFVDRFPEGAEGLVVHIAAKDGPLENAGIVRESLITHIDDNPVRYRYDFLDYTRSKSPGETVQLRLLLPDGGGPVEKQVELGSVDTGKE